MYEQQKRYLVFMLLGWCFSVPIKLIAAQNMDWSIDFVAVVAQAQATWNGGGFPLHGILSSVAAYNPPFLVWLHLPTSFVIHDPFWIIFLTMIVFNFFSTFFIYRAGEILVNQQVGFIAAILFTFSDMGISSAYLNWAQLLLPGFMAFCIDGLMRWHHYRDMHYGIQAGLGALCAFMTHFSAILYFPALLLGALFLRVKWSWRWSILGIILGSLIISPYLKFQLERSFIDVQAFIRRESLISRDVIEEYQRLSSNGIESSAEPIVSTMTVPRVETAPSFFTHLIQTSLNLILYLIEALALFQFMSMRTHPNLIFVDVLIRFISLMGFVWIFVKWLKLSSSYFKRVLGAVNDSKIAKNLLMILMIWFTIFIGLVATSATPTRQYTYYTSLIPIHLWLASYVLVRMMSFRQNSYLSYAIVIGGVVLVCFAASAERIARVILYDYQSFSIYNAWLYRHVSGVVE